MNGSTDLRALAGGEAPPFGFDEFERRQARRTSRRRGAALGAAGSLLALGFVTLVAVLTQQPAGTAALPAAAIVEPATHALPALVDLGQFEVTSQIEDHIALLDAEISVARVRRLPVERLREMESARAQLNDSLQRVSYAHELLSL